MKRWVAQTGGGALIIASTITAAVFGPDILAGDQEALVIATVGTKSQRFIGEVVIVKEPGHPWGRCDNPQTQADVEYCAKKGSGLSYTVRTVPFITEAETNSINAKTLRVRVNDTQKPTSLIVIP